MFSSATTHLPQCFVSSLVSFKRYNDSQGASRDRRAPLRKADNQMHQTLSLFHDCTTQQSHCLLQVHSTSAMSRYCPFRTGWVVVKGTSHIRHDGALQVEYTVSGRLTGQPVVTGLHNTSRQSRCCRMLDMTDIQRQTSKSKRNGAFKVDFARFRNDSTHVPFFTTHSNVSYHGGKPEPRG